MKEHIKLCKNSKKRHFQGKTNLLMQEIRKSSVKVSRLARIFILDSYDSSRANSSEDTQKNSHMHELSEMGEKAKILRHF